MRGEAIRMIRIEENCAQYAAQLSGLAGCGDIVVAGVEVTGDLSETTRVWAEPNGAFTGERTLGVTRFRRDGRWIDVDLNLVRNADGRWRRRPTG
jgi:hypothetical protein